MIVTKPPAPEPPARAREAQACAGRVLLAEDDAEMRSLLASALRRGRYEVLEAADGRELIERLNHSLDGGPRIDLIVTDVRMPRLTGTQALRLIHESGVEVPVVVITAFGDHVTRIDAWLHGAAAVLDKPFEIEDLMDEIQRLRIDP